MPKPIPCLHKKAYRITEIFFASRRVYDGLDGDSEKGKRKEQYEDPKDGLEQRIHGVVPPIIQYPGHLIRPAFL